MAGGLLAVSAAAAAAAGSIKLLWDAVRDDKGGLNEALTDKILKPAADWIGDNVGNLLGFGPQSPDYGYAQPPEWVGAQGKSAPMDKQQRAKEAAPFADQDIEDWKQQQAAKETAEAKKAGTLDKGNWWEKTPAQPQEQKPQMQQSSVSREVMAALATINAKIAGSGDVVAQIAGALSNFKGNSDKTGAKPAVQNVINDNSDRSITVTPQVSVTVQEIAKAAAQTASSTAKAVSSALSSANSNPPSRVMHGAHF
jgi:hypothetical protein